MLLVLSPLATFTDAERRQAAAQCRQHVRPPVPLRTEQHCRPAGPVKRTQRSRMEYASARSAQLLGPHEPTFSATITQAEHTSGSEPRMGTGTIRKPGTHRTCVPRRKHRLYAQHLARIPPPNNPCSCKSQNVNSQAQRGHVCVTYT